MQIREIVSKVALPSDIYQKMLAYLAKERDESNQPVAELKTQIIKEIPQIKLRLDRLLDAHLEGLIEKSEYQVKKETLLKTKVELEEKLVKLE